MFEARGGHDVMMAVDRRMRAPLYHQIYLILRGKIENGEFLPGALVSGEQDIQRQYNVSRITARRALDELAAAGLVERRRGSGTRVRDTAPSAPIRSSVEGLLENLLAMGLKTKVRLVSFGYAPAGPDVAAALERVPGATIQHAVRVRSVAQGPLSYLTTYVPEEIGRTFTRRDLASQPLLALMERGGIKVSGATQTVSATLADPVVAAALTVDVGAPLIEVRRIVRDQHGRPVEFIVALYRPDRYQVRMDLARVADAGHNSWAQVDAPAQPGRAGGAA